MVRHRNPNRIDPIIEKLRAAWKANPDMRLSQLVWNLARSGETAPKFFNTEDYDLDWQNVPCLNPQWEGTYWVEDGKPALMPSLLPARSHCGIEQWHRSHIWRLRPDEEDRYCDGDSR